MLSRKIITINREDWKILVEGVLEYDLPTSVAKLNIGQYMPDSDIVRRDPWKGTYLDLSSAFIELVAPHLLDQMGDGSCAHFIPIESHNMGNCTPAASSRKMSTLLNKLYTPEEIEECFHNFELEEVDKPIHYLPTYGFYHYTNIYYYDQNKAHSYMLGQIFPKLEPYLENFAVLAKQDRKYKGYPNLFVGFFNSLESKWYHPLTYNYIVNYVRTSLTNQFELIGGEPVYLNTDGLMVNNPLNPVEGTKKFGGYKLEQVDNHEVWTYRCSPTKEQSGYWVIQWYENGTLVTKGSCPVELRDLIDLPHHLTVSYKIKNYNGLVLPREAKQIKIGD